MYIDIYKQNSKECGVLYLWKISESINKKFEKVRRTNRRVGKTLTLRQQRLFWTMINRYLNKKGHIINRNYMWSWKMHDKRYSKKHKPHWKQKRFLRRMSRKGILFETDIS